MGTANRGASSRLVLLLALLLGLSASVFVAPDPSLVRATGIGNWNQTGDPVLPREAHDATDITAVGLRAGRTLLIGGRGGAGSTILNEAELYTPASGQFGAAGAGTLVEARYRHAAIELANGNVLVSGGTGDGTAAKASAEIWNAGSGTWSATASMNTPRLGHLLFLLTNGNVLAVGGKSTISGSPLTSTEIFNTTSNTWSAGPTMAQGAGATAQLTDGRILRVYPDGASEANFSGTTWNPTGHLTTPRTNFTLKALPGSRAVVLGGYGEGGTTDGARRIELFDANTQTWTLGKPMYDSRADADAHLLPDGTLLVYGGKAGKASDVHPVLTTEKLDLKTNTASQVTPTQDDAIGPVTVGMANADILSIGFREPGTNQTHHSLRYAAPAAQALLTVTANPLNFTPTLVGNYIGSFAITFVVNIGGSPVTVGAVALAGAGTVFNLADQCGGHILQPGQSCQVSLQFVPTAGIPYNATLTIPSNAAGGTITVPVYGNGSMGVSPTSVDFGASAVAGQGGVPAPHAITGIPVVFTNIFSGPFTSITVQTASINAGGGDFSIAADQCTGHILPFGVPCILIVGFTPQGGGEKNGSVLFQLSDGTNQVVKLHGVGTNQNYPVASFDAGTSLYFGTVNISSIGSYRNYKLLRVTNSGRAGFVWNINSTSNTNITGPNASDFVFTTGCISGATTIAPGDSCIMQFQFIPKTGSAGSRYASFNFQYTDAQNNPYTSTLSLQGTAVDPGVATKIMDVEGFRTTYNTTAVGSYQTTQLTIRNWGSTALTIASVGLDQFSLNNTDFLPDTNCNGVTLQPGGQVNGYCQVNVTFRPTRAGTRSAVLTVNAGSGISGSTSAFLIGAATGQGRPALSNIATGNLVNYGTQLPVAAGTALQSSLQQNTLIQITNTGTGILGGDASFISDNGAGFFSDNGSGIITDNGGGFSAGAGNLISEHGAGLITDNGGAFTSPSPAFTPREGVQPHTIPSAHYVGDPTQTTCAGLSKLEPGESCTIAVRFAPVTNGAKPATFTLPLNTVNDTHNGTMTVSASLPLTGDGVVAPKITSVPVAGGAAAGGSSLTIAGTGFQSGAKVYFGVPGGPNSTTATSVTATSLTLTTPALNPGDYDVTAVNPDGRASNLGRYHVLPANFVPTLPLHATGVPAMGSTPIPLPTPHPTSPPMPGGPMPTPTPLPQPGRH